MKFLTAVGAAVLVSVVLCAAQQSPQVLSPKTLEAAISANPQGIAAEQLAEQIRSAFGGRDALVRGGAPKIDELTVAWAIELPPAASAGPPPRVARDTGNMSYPMVQVGKTGVWALARHLSHGTAFTWHYEADGRRFGGSQLEVWETHPDARPHPGVPKGAVRFTIDGQVVATVPVDGHGQAQFPTATLTRGAHPVVAEYVPEFGGESPFDPSTGSLLDLLSG